MPSTDTSRGAFPLFQGLQPARGRIPADILAGITLAALAVPEVMGYTRISGTPVVTGLYTILVPMALFAFFGSSRHLVVGADSATAAILAAGIAGMAAPRSEEWVALAGLLALMSAAFLFLARVARLGFLANFLSRTVLIGFLTGVGIQVAVGEIPGLLGITAVQHGSIPAQIRLLSHGLQGAAWPTTVISAAVLAVIVGSRLVSRKIPGAMIAVVASIIASWALHLPGHGVSVLGAIPTGLPRFGLPQTPLSFRLIERLVPTAFAMFVVILAQSAATSRAYAERYNESFNENVDLVGLGLANVGAALSGTFVVNGSPTKTQMVESAGGSSQLAQITTSAVVLIILLFLTAPLSLLPTAVLSAVVFLIGIELIDIRGMKRIFVERPYEFWVALVTAATVVVAGVEAAILLAIVLSLVVHTRHGYLVRNVLLVSDSDGWHDRPLDSAAQAAPGLVIYRFLHSMYYANAQALRREIVGLASSAQPALHWICVDMVAVDDVDFTAAGALRTLQRIVAAKGIRVVFCELSEAVQHEFKRSDLVALFGADSFFPTRDRVLEAYREHLASDANS